MACRRCGPKRRRSSRDDSEDDSDANTAQEDGGHSQNAKVGLVRGRGVRFQLGCAHDSSSGVVYPSGRLASRRIDAVVKVMASRTQVEPSGRNKGVIPWVVTDSLPPGKVQARTK